MLRALRPLVPLALIALAAARGAAAQEVRGVVLDEDTGAPVSAALVLLVDSAGSAVASDETDAAGVFRIPIRDPGAYSVRAEHLGYTAATSLGFEVEGDPLVEVEFQLSTRAIELPPVHVRIDGRSAHLIRAGFYERQGLAMGRFISGDEIRERDPFVLTDLLRMEPSVQHLWDPANSRWTVIFRGAARMSFSTTTPCYPLVVLDGTRLSGSVALDDLAHPADVAAIELYPSGNGAPPQFSGLGAPCGIIVLWTRR